MKIRILGSACRLATVGLALLNGAIAFAAADGPAVLTSIRIVETSAASTQVLVELAADRPVKMFTLRGPDRVVLDIVGARSSGGVTLPAAHGIVRQVRLGQQSGEVLRLVIDTRRAVSPRLTTKASGDGQAVQLAVVLGDILENAAAQAAAPLGVQVPAQPPAKVRVVVIDAGHGGADFGSLGRAGTKEKDVTLAVARELAARVNAQPGWRALLTRSDDSAIDLRARVQRAESAGASLFVSLQANAVANPDVSGATVYIYDPVASSRNAAWLAERENAAPTVLLALVRGTTGKGPAATSQALAQAVLGELQPSVPLQRAEVQRAPLAGLQQMTVPAVLIDLASLANREDEQRLRSVDYAGKIADALTRTLHRYSDIVATDTAPSDWLSSERTRVAHDQTAQR